MYLPYLFLGEVYRKQQQFSLAIAAFKTVLDTQPRFMVAYMRLGRVYLDIGEPLKAKNSFEYALNLNPFSIRAYLGLADALIQLNQVDASYNVVEKLFEFNKNDFNSTHSSISGEPFDETCDLEQIWYTEALIKQKYIEYF